MPDLHTNLILNDKQFNDGLRRAEGGLSAFTSKVKGFSGGLKTALGLAGVGSTITALVDGFARMRDAQVRVNAGVGSFEDKWVSSRGAVSNILAELPLIGQMLDKIDRSWGGFEDEKLQFESGNRLKSMIADVEDRAELARASPERREMIRLQQEDRRIVKEIIELEKIRGYELTGLRSLSEDLFRLNAQELSQRQKIEATEKSIADYLRQQADAKSQQQSSDTFYDMVEREQITRLRRLGIEDEANKREAELNRSIRIRDVQNDPALRDNFDEMMRRLQIVDLLSVLDEEKKQVEDRTQSIGVGQVGSASILGQVFAPGAMNDQRREQKRLGDTAEKILTQLNRLVARRDNPSVYN